VPKPVVAFFGALRKAFGRAEDRRDIIRDPGNVAHRGAWELCIVVEPDPVDGGFVAECPDIPGAMSQGETEREAVENLIDAINTVLEVKIEQHFETVDFDMPNLSPDGRSKFSIPM
jgi:predicted RNase H-like HicB family nuclease